MTAPLFILLTSFQTSLPSPAAPGSAEPNLAVGPGNRVYMSWLEPADSGHALRFAVLNNNRWSAPRTIYSARNFFVNWADFPSLEVLGNGKLAAHWLQKTGSTTYAYGVRIAQSKDDGLTWSAPVTPHRDSTNTEHGFVALWRDRNALGAAWLDGRKFSSEEHAAGNEMQLVSTSIKPDGSLSSEVVLDPRTCDCCQNSAAMTANGPVVVYRNRSTDEIRDIYVARMVNGRWLEGKPVANDNWHMTACPVNGPAISAHANRAVVAWFTAANDTPRVRVAFSKDAAASFNAALRVDDGQPAGRVDVALLDNGDAIVTWIERIAGQNSEVRSRRVTAAGRIGKSVTIASTTAARASGFPRMVVAGSDVVLAWTVAGKPSSISVTRRRIADIR